MEQKKPKGQKGFAIVNIIVGVILTIAGFAMFTDPSVGPGGIIAIAIGIAVWVIGAYALKTLKNYYDDEVRMKKAKLMNTVCFVFSCIVLSACTILPILGSIL